MFTYNSGLLVCFICLYSHTIMSMHTHKRTESKKKWRNQRSTNKQYIMIFIDYCHFKSIDFRTARTCIKIVYLNRFFSCCCCFWNSRQKQTSTSFVYTRLLCVHEYIWFPSSWSQIHKTWTSSICLIFLSCFRWVAILCQKTFDLEFDFFFILYNELVFVFFLHFFFFHSKNLCSGVQTRR